MNIQLIRVLLFLNLFFSLLSANVVLPTDRNENILIKSDIYIDENNLILSEVLKNNYFHKHTLNYINLGFAKGKTVWIKITLHNNADKQVSKILEIKNPLLEEVILFDESGVIKKAGMLHIGTKQTTMEPSFAITIKKKSVSTYYLKIINNTTALRFGLYLKNKELFVYENHIQVISTTLFIGIIIALFLYNFSLFFYTRENAYLYYCFYLAILIYNQITYLGITPLLFPKGFVEIDNLSVLLKVNMMYISAAMFAKSFLQTKNHLSINRIYNFIILLAIIEIPLFGTPWFYYPEIGVLTGLFFILYNLYAGIRIYLNGYKQARFFIAAWSILVFAFLIIIIDALGLVSIMQKIPNLILYTTTIEALLLSLAFGDKYSLIVEEKAKTDQLLVTSLTEQQTIIKNEIQIQTKKLFHTLENKKILLKELHHRIKNNLQLIISIIRMQKDKTKPVLKSQFQDLETRIVAISQTYEMLYQKENLQEIDMQEYIYELCEKIKYGFENTEITINIDAHNIFIPLKEASYIGLLINEIVINAIKYAQTQLLIINIVMKEKGKNYILHIGDNGETCNIELEKKNTLGISLIKTLVENQLEGNLRMEYKNGLSYMINFKL